MSKDSIFDNFKNRDILSIPSINKFLYIELVGMKKRLANCRKGISKIAFSPKSSLGALRNSCQGVKITTRFRHSNQNN